MSAFRSLTVALTAIVLNLLSIGASYGVMVLVFQHHWFDSILGYTSTGTIATWIPLFMFAILFGLSMDYHVFILSRVVENRRLGMSTRDAVERGIASTAGVITSAAVIMVAVFSVFGTLSQVSMKQVGVGLAVGCAARCHDRARRAAAVSDGDARRAQLVPAALDAAATLLGSMSTRSRLASLRCCRRSEFSVRSRFARRTRSGQGRSHDPAGVVLAARSSTW